MTTGFHPSQLARVFKIATYLYLRFFIFIIFCVFKHNNIITLCLLVCQSKEKQARRPASLSFVRNSARQILDELVVKVPDGEKNEHDAHYNEHLLVLHSRVHKYSDQDVDNAHDKAKHPKQDCVPLKLVSHLTSLGRENLQMLLKFEVHKTDCENDKDDANNASNHLFYVL